MKKVVLVLLGIIGGMAAFIASRPGTYHVERTATVAAAPDVVYAQIADFNRWAAWSPWEKLDPNMKKTIEGHGVGSSYRWVGNSDAGEGMMTVTEAIPASRIGMRLEFIKPFASVNTCTFDFSPTSDGTSVKWSMDGTNNFMSKAMGLFMSMDQMIGKDFEEGLANLDRVAAAATPEAAPADTAAVPAP